LSASDGSTFGNGFVGDIDHLGFTAIVEMGELGLWARFELGFRKVLHDRENVCYIGIRTRASGLVDKAFGYEPKDRGFESLLAH
jgi:hypothetical protein